MPEEHLWHFSKKSLTKLIEKVGYKVIYAKQVSGVFDKANPILGLWLDLKLRPLAFIKSISDVPGNIITSIFNVGTDLTVVIK